MAAMERDYERVEIVFNAESTSGQHPYTHQTRLCVCSAASRGIFPDKIRSQMAGIYSDNFQNNIRYLAVVHHMPGFSAVLSCACILTLTTHP